GTGTQAGDPVELQALGSVLSCDRPPDRACLVGSIKTNFGHTEGAAGVAGLIKVALVLQHREIPASLHFETPNPSIPWDRLPLTIPREAMPWPDAVEPALGAVNSFGIAGTNAHLVLEAPPESRVASPNGRGPAAETSRARLLNLSAASPTALRDMANRYAD